MSSLPELTYNNLPEFDPSAEDFPDAHVIQDFFTSTGIEPPVGIIISAISFKAGGFRRTVKIEGGPDYTNASQTTIIFADDGEGGILVIPVLAAWEKNGIPHEIAQELPSHAALVTVNHDSIQSAHTFLDTLKSAHTHPTTPHTDLYTTPREKKRFQARQLGQDAPPTIIRRRPSDPASVKSTDGIPWE